MVRTRKGGDMLGLEGGGIGVQMNSVGSRRMLWVSQVSAAFDD